MKICACDLKGRGGLVIGGEYAGSQGSKLESFFGDNAIRCQSVICDYWDIEDKKARELESLYRLCVGVENF